MRRARGGAVGVLLAALLTAGCSKAPAPAEIPAPGHIDLAQVKELPQEENGIILLPGPDAVRQTVLAARAAGPVRVRGTYLAPKRIVDEKPVPGRSLQFEWQGTPDAAIARVSSDDAQIEVRLVGDQAFVRSNKLLPAAGAELEIPADGYACWTRPQLKSQGWAALLNPQELLSSLAGNRAGQLSPATDGKVAILIHSESGTAGTLTVSTVGPPLPQQLLLGDETATFEMVWSGWGEGVAGEGVSGEGVAGEGAAGAAGAAGAKLAPDPSEIATPCPVVE